MRQEVQTEIREHGLFGALDAGAGGSAALRACVATSLNALDEEHRSALLLLALFPGAFESDGAAAVLGMDDRKASAPPTRSSPFEVPAMSQLAPALPPQTPAVFLGTSAAPL